MIAINQYQLALNKLIKTLEEKRVEMSKLFIEYDRLKEEVKGQRIAKNEARQQEEGHSNEKWNLVKQINIMTETFQQGRQSFIELTEKQQDTVKKMLGIICNLGNKIEELELKIEIYKGLDEKLINKKNQILQNNIEIGALDVKLQEANKELNETINKKSSFLQTINDKIDLLNIKEQEIAKREKGLRINLEKLTKLKNVKN